MVAKTFQTYEIIAEPYEKNSKLYVDVRNPKTNKIRSCRWYTEKEYYKLYPEEVKLKNKREYGPQKDVLGFKNKDYIIFFKEEDIDEYKNWFKENGLFLHKTRFWGWGTDADESTEFPFGLTPIRLNWSSIGDEDGYLKSEEIVTAYVNSLKADCVGNWQGEVGDKIEIDATVVKIIPVNSVYNDYTFLYLLVDDNNEEYIWITKSRNWAINEKKKIKGAIKEHKIYNGKRQTYLTRCKEI